MKLLISPAKKMQTCEDDLGEVGRLSQPLFLAEAERLRQKLASFSLAELRALLGCNPQIAAENFERYQQQNPTEWPYSENIGAKRRHRVGCILSGNVKWTKTYSIDSRY